MGPPWTPSPPLLPPSTRWRRCGRQFLVCRRARQAACRDALPQRRRLCCTGVTALLCRLSARRAVACLSLLRTHRAPRVPGVADVPPLLPPLAPQVVRCSQGEVPIHKLFGKEAQALVSKLNIEAQHRWPAGLRASGFGGRPALAVLPASSGARRSFASQPRPVPAAAAAPSRTCPAPAVSGLTPRAAPWPPPSQGRCGCCQDSGGSGGPQRAAPRA